MRTILLLMTVPLFGADCGALAGLKLKDTTLTASDVAAGAFAPGPGMGAASLYKDMPAFCRVQGVIKPSGDSNIEFEVWLPESGWNGKYQGVGNGGFAGSIQYALLAAGVRSGYATASTDTGHKGGATDGDWAMNHYEKIVDFGYRAIHEMTDASKAIVKAYYGGAAKRSYFAGCSNGGRQALLEAQRYPADYDGIVAGAPANYLTHHLTGFVWNMQALDAAPIPAGKMKAIEAAAVEACDASDGVKDGVIDDPTRCHFDPAVLACKGAESDACLTEAQIGALKKIYAGPKNSKGEEIFPGFEPGGETGFGGWPGWITGMGTGKSIQFLFAKGFFSDMMYSDANWDFRKFDFDRDTKYVDDKGSRNFNATDPNLKVFKDRGGKLILFHGWSDAAIPPVNTIHYYTSVEKKMGKQSASFVELYMVPGMQHCGGGPGPNDFGGIAPNALDPEHSMTKSLERWVEEGVAPQKVIAKNGARTRPLCPYPQVAKYKGSGSTDDASNFVCSAPK
ncbi:MAG: tannase/feruloyl esterase family alpha/beta hydrolase [Acidobacteriia bacterium]|nr:tannase/feruloyl esterase family alpha/beta hydrolase [Terriglobia bacterium]